MQDLWNLLNSSIFILVASGVIGYIKGYIDKYTKTNARKEKMFNELLDSNRKLLEQSKQNAERDEELRKQIEDITEVVQHVTAGSKVLLRDRIIQSCRVFLERGEINRMARNNITDMYHWYHDELHGNGLGELYYQKMMELPLVDEDMPIVSKIQFDDEIFRREEK